MNENNNDKEFYTFIKTTVRLARAIQSEIYQGAKNKHITKLEIDILMVIWVSDNHQCRPSKLIDFLKITKSQLSRSLTALYEKGLIEKNKDQSNKKYLIVSLTKYGQDLVVRNASNIKFAMEQEVEKLSNDERKILNETITF
ncbi:MarR family winged helix-turn-helix transcriptional regulator [Companilactobacillus hulinensis]|uniref:MarR family winged helix-turn-helix transcriptional regulator n=1 Tax=Companilactobacillus hulinensis TaxID=2486007 RepID=UPI000F78F9F3|nr:MarR family winged helix-turn-helix transcriptional regulator [Companilactobacillus hulinensis]